MTLNQLAFYAVRASLDAGAKILKYYKKGVEGVQKAKDEYDSPLTVADLSAHKAIEDYLGKVTPEIPVFSEESREIPYAKRKDWKEFWLVDPLDGTKEFLNHNGEFTVNIALIRENSPVLGVVYAPALSELYFAHEEIGSIKANVATDQDLQNLDQLISKGNRLKVDKKKLKKNKISAVVSRSYLSEDTKVFLEELQKDYVEEIERVSFGSSLKFCRVAENNADIYPNLGHKSEWDIAAGHAVLKFADGEVIEYPEKNEIKYNKEKIQTPFFVAR